MPVPFVVPTKGLYGLSELYLFPVFQTREDFARIMGYEPPKYDPSRPVKSWMDAAALNSPIPRVLYERVLCLSEGGSPLADASNSPFFEPLMLPKQIAATVNLKPKDFTGKFTELPETGVEVPVPCRDLLPEERLIFGLGGLVQVRNTKYPLDPTGNSTFTEDDRAILYQIAAKLGVPDCRQIGCAAYQVAPPIARLLQSQPSE